MVKSGPIRDKRIRQLLLRSFLLSAASGRQSSQIQRRRGWLCEFTRPWLLNQTQAFGVRAHQIFYHKLKWTLSYILKLTPIVLQTWYISLETSHHRTKCSQETNIGDFSIVMMKEQQQGRSWEAGIVYLNHKINFNGESRKLSNKICHGLIAVVVY